MKYQVQLKVYEGPLDLLLKRVKREEIPIGEIPICEIIDQFLDYFLKIAISDLEEGSRFLVLAATLLAVKARLLLPKREEEESDLECVEDEQDGMLESDMEEYLAVQEAAAVLEDKAKEWMLSYQRLSRPQDKPPEPRGTRDDVSRLVEAFQEVLERISALPEPYSVQGVPFDLDAVMSDVLMRISCQPEGMNFKELFPAASSKKEVVITFLAVLELVYEGKVRVLQNQDTEGLFLAPIL